MPLYDFTCPKCKETKEFFMKHDAPTPKCEHDGETMVKEFTTPAFQFTNGHGTGMGNMMSIAGHPLKS